MTGEKGGAAQSTDTAGSKSGTVRGVAQMSGGYSVARSKR